GTRGRFRIGPAGASAGMRGDPGYRRPSPPGAPRGERPALSAEALSRAATGRHRRQDPGGNCGSMCAPQARRRVVLCRSGGVPGVEPASKRGGGAILGDKTRMAELARAPEAFIRPSSAGDSRGGIARRTREAILLCEAAGFDTVLVETIGVGQAETAVAEIV